MQRVSSVNIPLLGIVIISNIYHKKRRNIMHPKLLCAEPNELRHARVANLDVMTGYQCRWVVFSDVVSGDERNTIHWGWAHSYVGY